MARKGEWKGVYITVEEKEYLVNGASFPAYFVVKQNLIESQLILDIQTAGGKKTSNQLNSKKYGCIVHGALVKQQKNKSVYVTAIMEPMAGRNGG